MYDVPPCLVDPALLPPPLMTSEPGSFAYNTFKVRIPAIIDEIVSLNHFPPYILSAMQVLRDEVTDGYITALREQTADTRFWHAAAQPWSGHSWLDAPWYWAEAYFYRRVLEATRYFQPSDWSYVDPYAPQKRAELALMAAPAALRNVLTHLPQTTESIFEVLLHASLWGNRTDLSYNVASQIGPAGRVDNERSNLLVDDSSLVWEHVASQQCAHAAIITDNAGTELLMDLALCEFLLNNGIVSRISLHLKPQPFFVSDAMRKDVWDSIQALERAAEPLHSLGARLRAHLDAGRLVMQEHWFYTTSLHYYQMPVDLIEQLAAVDFVLLKGDANYRRLLGDAHWPETTNFKTATAYFPAPFVSLRTLKAELIIGLAPGQTAILHKQDPSWRTNGRRGVIQSNLA